MVSSIRPQGEHSVWVQGGGFPKGRDGLRLQRPLGEGQGHQLALVCLGLYWFSNWESHAWGSPWSVTMVALELVRGAHGGGGSHWAGYVGWGLGYNSRRGRTG